MRQTYVVLRHEGDQWSVVSHVRAVNADYAIKQAAQRFREGGTFAAATITEFPRLRERLRAQGITIGSPSADGAT